MAIVSNTVKARISSEQSVQRTRTPRIASQSPVQRTRTPRISSNQGIAALIKARISSGPLTKTVKARISSTNQVQKTIKPRLRSPHADFEATIQTGVPASGDSILVQVWWDGELRELTLGCNSIEFTKRESAPGSWSMTLVDEHGEYHPRYAAGDWFGWLNSKAFNASGEVAKKVIISGVRGGTPWRFEGLPTAFSDRQTGDRTAFTFEYSWSGAGISHILFRPTQTMATVRSTRDSVISSRTALAQVTTEMNCPADWSRVDSYPVRVQHRQASKPAEWISKLLEIPVAEWREQGNQVVGYQPKQEPAGSAQWRFDLSSIYVEEINTTDEVFEVVNEVTVTRAQETGGAITDGNGEPVEFNNTVSFGQQTVQFPSPYYGVTHRAIRQTDCIVSDFVYRNEKGEVVAVSEVRAGIWPVGMTRVGDNVKSVTFTVGQLPGGTALEGYAHVRWFGSPRDRKDDEAFDAVADTVFTVTCRDFDSIDEHGLQPREIGPLPLCPNSTWATRHGNRWLAKNGRARRKRQFRVPFNPLIEPGETIALIHPHTGTVATYITEVSHSLQGYFPLWKTTVTVVEYT